MTYIPLILKKNKEKNGRIQEAPTTRKCSRTDTGCGGDNDNNDNNNKNGDNDLTEAEAQKESEDETSQFRACDDRTIETNGLKKFSKNVDLGKRKSVADQLMPVGDGKGPAGETKELAIRVKAGRGTEQKS